MKPVCPRSGGCDSWQSCEARAGHLQPRGRGGRRAPARGRQRPPRLNPRTFQGFPQLSGVAWEVAQSAVRISGQCVLGTVCSSARFFCPVTLRLRISPLLSPSSKPAPPHPPNTSPRPGLGPREAAPSPGRDSVHGLLRWIPRGSSPPQLPPRAPWKGEGKGLSGRLGGGWVGDRAGLRPRVGRDEKRPEGGFRFPGV